MSDRHYILFLLFFLTISCKGTEESGTKPQKQEIANTKTKSKMEIKEVITEEKLKKTTFTEASGKFGKPMNERNFMFGEDSSEFTISLRNHFTEKELLSKTIPIKEVTWKLDKDNNITAWYRSDKKDKPIEVYVWNKDAEF